MEAKTKTWTKDERERLLTIIETALLAALALVALWLLDVDLDKIASISAPQWALIATGVTGVVVAVRNALRGSVRRATPARVSRTSETIPPPRPDREGGSVQLGALLWLALACGLTLLLTLPGCGASALSAHARASSVLTVALEGADHLADVGGEVAMAACTSIECTHDVEDAVEAIDAGVATVALPIGAYVQAVEMALAGGEDVDVLSALGAVLLRALEAWDELVPLYRPLGVELPQLPRSIHALVELVAAVTGAGS